MKEAVSRYGRRLKGGKMGCCSELKLEGYEINPEVMWGGKGKKKQREEKERRRKGKGVKKKTRKKKKSRVL